MKTKTIIFFLFLTRLAFGQSTDSKDFGAKFVEAINSTDTSFYQKIGDELLVEGLRKKSIALFKSLHSRYAPMDYHHYEVKGSGERYIMHIYGRKQGELMYADFQLQVSPPPSHLIVQLFFIAEVTDPINLPNGSITDAYTLDWIKDYVQSLNQKYDLSGSILLMQEEKPIFQQQFGFADAQRSKPVDSSTLFGIASGGKMFTALAIMQLVEKGKLKLTDKTTRYIKGFSDPQKAAQISIHHLLSHTSGIKEYWSGQNDVQVLNAKTIAEHLAVALKVGFAFEPGTDYQYCNTNFILLGAIIEKVSGQSYYEYVQKNIFDPCGMKNTSYPTRDEAFKAEPLVRDGNKWKISEKRGNGRGSSAGGAVSNAEDIFKFSLALRGGKLLNPANFAKMIAVQNAPFQDPEGYGYGFILDTKPNRRSYGHGGTADGVNFEFRYFPDKDITLIILNNQNSGAYDDLKRNVIKLITDER